MRAALDEIRRQVIRIEAFLDRDAKRRRAFVASPADASVMGVDRDRRVRLDAGR